MIDQLESLRKAAVSDIQAADTLPKLEGAKTTYLGSKSEIRALNKQLGKLSPEERGKAGAAIQTVVKEVEQLYADKKQQLEDQEALGADANLFDITLPGLPLTRGALHPITKIIHELNEAFLSLGFEVYDHPEIVSEHDAFDNLNFQPNHSARDSMDTYYLEDRSTAKGDSPAEILRDESGSRLCLRPHLTGASVQYMLSHKPPFRFVYPGRVYRNEEVDARHEKAFFQYEALVVDREVPFSSGQLLIQTVLERAMNRKVETRMRAGFFPFVEPGFEIDMKCLVCEGAGCSTCKHVGWIEIMPGGAPHPNVLRAGGIDPMQWTGFYVNIGLDRLVMMRTKLDDVRNFHSADLRFLSQSL